MREAFRQVLHSLLKPLGCDSLPKNFKLKLDPAAALELLRGAAGGRHRRHSARAFGSLVTGGLTPAVRRRRWWASITLRFPHESFRERDCHAARALAYHG